MENKNKVMSGLSRDSIPDEDTSDCESIIESLHEKYDSILYSSLNEDNQDSNNDSNMMGAASSLFMDDSKGIRPTLPPLNNRPRQNLTGFGLFLVELASLLSFDQVMNLATFFEYRHGTIDKIARSSHPSREFVNIMEIRGQISPNDISQLTSALELETFGLFGLSNQVKDAFRKHPLHFNTAPEEQYLASAMAKFSMDEETAKNTFISELKVKYENMYEAVQPIPYIRDKLMCVARVFVECGIEYYAEKGKLAGVGTWKRLKSYQDIFTKPEVKSPRRILEADPGFGKSTITLQIAYDWCNSTVGSFLCDLEILILLRLRQLGGVKSIYRAIKSFLLPIDSTLKEDDVRCILQNATSVLILLDGFDEYPDRENDELSDVKSIISRDMFQNYEVLITTRTACLPPESAPQTKRIRLTGFDEKARDDYIRKAVVSDDEDAITKIKNVFQKNSVLAAICEVPLFFAMFAQVTHDTKDTESSNSVTTFFRHMILCFHRHMENKLKGKSITKLAAFRQHHQQLDAMAFNSLNGNKKQIVWRKEEMRKKLGAEFYDYYVNVGILVEEDLLDADDSDDLLTMDIERIKYVKKVHFVHKLFCEWYAAHHLSNLASKFEAYFYSEEEYFHLNDLPKNVRKLKPNATNICLDPSELQYVYRFACGLNRLAAEQIIEYFRFINDSLFGILCILEESNGHLENVLDDVTALCERDVQVRDTDGTLLQRTTLQLLQIAGSNGIPISEVWLYYSFSTLETSAESLLLKSELRLAVLDTLCKLVIVEDGKTMTSEEFCDILKYSSKCAELRSLRVVWCLLPESVQTQSFPVLQSRNAKVTWSPGSLLRQYHLNLKSGLWEDEESGTSINEEEYAELIRYFDGREKRNARRRHSDCDEEYYCEISSSTSRGSGERGANVTPEDFLMADEATVSPNEPLWPNVTSSQL